MFINKLDIINLNSIKFLNKNLDEFKKEIINSHCKIVKHDIITNREKFIKIIDNQNLYIN